MCRQNLELRNGVITVVTINESTVSFEKYAVGATVCEKSVQEYQRIDIFFDGRTEFFLCRREDETDVICGTKLICTFDNSEQFIPRYKHGTSVVEVSSANGFRRYSTTGDLLYAKQKVGVTGNEEDQTDLTVDLKKKFMTVYKIQYDFAEDFPYNKSLSKADRTYQYTNIECRNFSDGKKNVEILFCERKDNKIDIWNLSDCIFICSCERFVEAQHVLGQCFIKVANGNRFEIYTVSGYRKTFSDPEYGEIDTNMVFLGAEIGFEVTTSTDGVITYNNEGERIHTLHK